MKRKRRGRGRGRGREKEREREREIYLNSESHQFTNYFSCEPKSIYSKELHK